ncbi:SRPBCC family protein [Kribbella sp. CA-293567]|uniref:SRPBCC family protein n=1 Tax=Kribbella sp. CA-293567 TaxID=3002436 RepID=UPI0022DDFC5C|nr:SRPBCC domain-containing protein [Kribbella sp. CA-293567]WBQ03214.1 SRPBCC domain-containing protein [Kribbella sp. CA-293567]
MVDILHRVGVKATVAEVYTAITTVEGLAAWWTTQTVGEGNEIGGVLKFRFIPGGFDMSVVELVPGKRVLWEVIDGPEEWIGTHIVWDLTQVDEWAIVNFRHEGWKEEVEFMSHCSTKWAIYLMSLKTLVETGLGAPAPDDVMISNWH